MFICLNSSLVFDKVLLRCIELYYTDLLCLVLVLRKMEGGLLLTSSVPFSCCDILSPRPCIEVDVIDSSRHFAYDASSDLTIYQAGCVDQLTDSLNRRAILHLDNILLSLFIMMVINKTLRVAFIHRCFIISSLLVLSSH